MWNSTPPTGANFTPDSLRQRVVTIGARSPQNIDVPSGFRPASVFVPFHFTPKPHLLFVKRPQTMRDHPGQIAFPGGKMEPGETPEETALREFSEELGIPPNEVLLWGRLRPVPSAVTHYWIIPVVGEVPFPMKGPQPNPAEVEEWFFVPFELLLYPTRQRCERILVNGNCERVDYLYLSTPQGERMIWGATARILRGFFLALFDPPFSPSLWFLDRSTL